MKKRCISVLLFLTLLFSLAPATVFAAGRNTAFEEGLAQDLKALNLFRGVSETDFALNRAPTRIEALVMLIRVLGEEDRALERSWKHPFTDVPGWADRYVGYAYRMGLTNGSSTTKYGVGTASSAMYLTFVLRALGYSDDGSRDFTWNDPFPLAASVGLLPECVNTQQFLRADVVSVSYAALPVSLRESRATLAEQLMDAGVFTQAQYEANYDPRAFDRYDPDAQTPPAPPANTEVLHYSWNWGGSLWTYDLPIPAAAVDVYKSIERDPWSYETNYSSYVYEPSDDEYLQALAQVFLNTAAENGCSKDAAVELAVCFVQSLRYIPDNAALAYDYPKYPLETLYDKGGDCEDTSILLVSLIREMGYGCCLVAFDDHMGAGILGDPNRYGYYFEEAGNRYYYVETTDEGWEIGNLPTDLIDRPASIWTF